MTSREFYDFCVLMKNDSNILFANNEKYLIKTLEVEIGLKDDYFKKEMKQHFMGYLQDKLPEKNTTTKPKKI